MSLKYKTGNFCLSPEDISENVAYCFTFNPQIQPLDIDSSKSANSSLWQFDPHDDLVERFNLKTWYIACRNLFENMKGCKTSDMIVEISAKGRYHFHGRLTVVNIMLFYTFDIPILERKSHYYICPQMGDAPTDKKEVKYKTWDEYLSKQQTFIKPYLKKHGIEYTDDLIDDNLGDKYLISRDGRLKQRTKEVFTKKCRLCKVEYKTTLKKSITCDKCSGTNKLP